MIHELKTVILTTDLPNHGLKVGDLGTVELVHEYSGYEVEFMMLGVKPWQWFRCPLTKFVLWATGRLLTDDWLQRNSSAGLWRMIIYAMWRAMQNDPRRAKATYRGRAKTSKRIG